MQYTNIHIVQDDYQKSFLQNVCQSQDCFEVYSEIFTNKKDLSVKYIVTDRSRYPEM